MRTLGSAIRAIWTFIVANLYGCRIYTGTYTGDGTLSQAIAVPFQPKFVKCWVYVETSTSDLQTSEKTEDFATNFSATDLTTHGISDDHIPTLTATGFTVDDNNNDEHPNKADQVYCFLALG